MTTINKINFSALQPFNHKATRSFELLIYQLAKKELGHLGTFTPIAGDGGDGGIEFFLQLSNGEIWGWQCKFYEDNGRLSHASRTKSIENSLETACKNYPGMTQWTLCLRTDLTVGLTTKKGDRQKGELDWFNDTLPLKIPAGQKVTLKVQGESEIVSALAEPKNYGLRQFFFGELEINQEWFKTRCEHALNKTKEKYDPCLHTIGDYQQSLIDSALLNPHYKDLVERLFADIPRSISEIHKDIDEFSQGYSHNPNEKELRSQLIQYFSKFTEVYQKQHDWFNLVMACIQDFDLSQYNNLIRPDGSDQGAYNYLKEFPKADLKEGTSLKSTADNIYNSMRRYFENYDRVVRNYLHQTSNYMIFLGNAAAGKTHVSCDIVYNRLKKELPALLLTGDSFNNESNLAEAFLKLLDIPKTYSLSDLLTVMDNYGKVHGVKIPIVIDGLNETVQGRYFSSIWRDHLTAFYDMVAKTDNLVLIATCRNSYKDTIWNDSYRHYFHYLERFDYDIIREAVDKYFEKYRITADLTFANLYRFERPIFLRIFCEIKNPDWQAGQHVRVNIDSDSNNQLFGLYFQRVNEKLLRTSHLLRKNEAFVQQTLNKLAEYLWSNNLREIPIDDYYWLIDGDQIYAQGNSKADLLIDEGLMLTRDIREAGEFVSLTFEIIAGFIIAKYLVNTKPEPYFYPRGEFHQKVREGNPHPLYENIVQEVALLMPQYKTCMLHDFYGRAEDPYIHDESVRNLWRLQGQYIRPGDIDIVKSYFSVADINRKNIVSLFRITLTEKDHPLNSCMLSTLLFNISVSQRDLSWSEHLRMESYEFRPLLEEIILECRNEIIRPEAEERLHLLMIYIQWFLTTTDRKLRDLATKALYCYGCRFPVKFSGMVYDTLPCNDPYVSERMLAALYGVVLSKQKPSDASFQTTELPVIALSLYELMFKNKAPYYTSHVLARDYASRTIKVALHYNAIELAASIPIQDIQEPYKQSKALKFKVVKGADKIYRGPMRMDFSNYTLGGLVKNGLSYQNPPEKTKVRGQIFHRVYELGWSMEDFEEIDKYIENMGSYDRQRPAVERYGKKYCWIAYFELAGYREDLGLLDHETFKDFRSSEADIDPCFPEKPEESDFPIVDLLGDRSIPLAEWLKIKDLPPIENCMRITENGHEWVCMDGYINQVDNVHDRARFTFIRGLIVKQDDIERFMPLFLNQRLGGRWIPEILQNHYSFAGELYFDEFPAYANVAEISFELSRKKKRVKDGEEGYFPTVTTRMEGNKLIFTTKRPKSKIVDDIKSAKFEVLIPVMEYAWSGNDFVNNIGHYTVLSKELAKDMQLFPQPSSFELLTANEEQATIYKESFSGAGRKYRLAFLRKDLLDAYLSKMKLNLVFGIWGEKEPKFDFEYRKVFNKDNGTDGYFEFQDVRTYEG